jgi:hypothetical protein
MVRSARLRASTYFKRRFCLPSPGGGGSARIERSEMRDGVGWRSYGTRSRLPPLAASPPHPARYASDPPPPGKGEAHFRILATHCARGLQIRSPQNRGRREDRVRAAPAISRAKVANKNAHEHTGSAETLRPSLRNGFTAYLRALPGETIACLSPSPPGSVSFPRT